MNDTPPIYTTREDIEEITQLLEDTVEHLCDANTLSGEFVWGVIECLAIAKQAQLKGLVD
jgi:hypothetical protein